MLLLQEAQVQSLVEILRFYMPCGAAENIEAGQGGGEQRNQMNKKNNKKHRSVVAKSEGAG